jgi:hypothetical protein
MADRAAGFVDEDLLDAAITVFSSRLPPDWSVEKTRLGGADEDRDLLIKGPFGSPQAPILVETRRDFSPRDIQAFTDDFIRRLRRQAGEMPVLLIAPYLSPRTRELLAGEQISYIDLTGNIRIALRNPPVFIETQGSQRSSAGPARGRGIRGAKAGAVARALIDVRPPYSGAEIARVAGVNEGYASRILDSLEDEGIIERPGRGPIMEVDWEALIRRRAEVVDLLKPTGTYPFVARNGPAEVLDQLRSIARKGSVAATGSFAAARLAPVAAPAMLILYAMEPRRLADGLGLMPVEFGADVILVRPDNEVVFQRAEPDGNLLWAAPSQVAIDCLSGGGRMPAEGEAVIGWMRANEEAWRLPSIRTVLEPLGG